MTQTKPARRPVPRIRGRAPTRILGWVEPVRRAHALIHEILPAALKACGGRVVEISTDGWLTVEARELEEAAALMRDQGLHWVHIIGPEAP